MISGNLRSMPFADLMQWIAMSQKSGTLVVKGRRFTKKILFRQGLVDAVTSNNPREHLGYYLVGWGYISEEELTRLLSQQQTQKVALGELLVQSGRMTRDEVDRIIRIKTEVTIYDLMLWEEGEFFLLDEDAPRREFQGLALPVDHFLFEGARQADETRRIRELIPDASYIPTIVQAVDEASLSPQQLAMLWEINGEQSLETIALRCRVPVFEVLSFVYHGMRAGVFGLKPPPEKTTRIPGATGASWRELIREAENSFTLGDYYEAYKQLCTVRERFGSVGEAVEHANALEQRLEAEVARTSLGSEVILELALSIQEIGYLNCSPEEGFVLSRINGLYTLPQILPLLPGPKLKNQLIIHNLMQRGIVKIQESRAVGKRETSVPFRRP
ncbi:MAG TPA: DUF4388 domain-containing protein [Thermoanaerobaculaceae bacterium]|nr:DUF4388 domain-containing protein [Thermoanaerobaculaceae bacterium]HRS16685.1 DUF4388 domain-containing protein [Thermoanaerobaculaceae bacterium]